MYGYYEKRAHKRARTGNEAQKADNGSVQLLILLCSLRLAVRRDASRTKEHLGVGIKPSIQTTQLLKACEGWGQRMSLVRTIQPPRPLLVHVLSLS